MVVSVVLGIACRHDAWYPFKTTGAAESPVITGQCEAGYYLSVVEKRDEPAGTRRFGLEWAYRLATKGRVSAGFPKKAVAQFSSRRAQITKTTLALAEQYEKDVDTRWISGRWRAGAGSPTRRRATQRGRRAGLHRVAGLLGNGPRVWPSLRRCATPHEPSGAAPRRNRTDRGAPTHASNARIFARLASRGEVAHPRERAVMAPVSRGRTSHEQAAALLGTGIWQLQAQLYACAAGG